MNTNEMNAGTASPVVPSTSHHSHSGESDAAAVKTTEPKAEAAKNQKGGRWRMVRLALVLVFLAGVVGDWLWAMSGSPEWTLAREGDGVKVYRLKAPGDRSIKVKAVMVGDYTLSQLTALHIIDDNLQTCQEWFPNCVDFTRIMTFDPVKGYDIDMWRLDFPFPFDDRELLISTIVSQDPKTKTVVLDVVAMPDTRPHNEGRVRIQRMHNRWQFTPRADGKVEVELIQDTEMGGLFPYFLLNMVAVDENYKFFSKELPSFLSKEKYVKADLSFIDDIR